LYNFLFILYILSDIIRLCLEFYLIRSYIANVIKPWGYRVELIVGLTHSLVVERP